MLNDLRFAVRSLAKTPGFTTIAVLTLAVGIGASASIFSALRALVLDAFSHSGADRVVQVWQNDNGGMSIDDFFDLRSQMTSLADIGGYTPYPANVGGDNPQAAHAVLCTTGVLESFGVAPQIGRLVKASDMEKGAPMVAVLSDAFWRQQFAGDPSALGRRMRVDGNEVTVIGVMPAAFEFASPWMRTQSCQFWMALKITPGDAGGRGSRWMNAVGRLKEGVTVAAANSEIQAVSSRIAGPIPTRTLATIS
jgi:putative ABC transport system permease protein